MSAQVIQLNTRRENKGPNASGLDQDAIETAKRIASLPPPMRDIIDSMISQLIAEHTNKKKDEEQ